MPIGDYYFINHKKSYIKKLVKLLGTLDLHTHIRLNPLLKIFINYINEASVQQKSINILEIGCGNGINAFEIVKIAKKYNKKINYIGTDLNCSAINIAEKIASNHGLNSYSFYIDDGISFVERNIDIILFIDVIEHIENTSKLLELSYKCLKEDGIFIVSVPTRLYSKIFGRDFCKKIGHIIDGYSIEELDELFRNSIDCIRMIYEYNTGIFSKIGCYLYYNKLNFNNKYFNFLVHFILYPFKFTDFYNNSKISCSLFAVYKKMMRI